MNKVTTKIPDGNGGWLEVEGDAVVGMEADGTKQADAMSKQWFEEAGGLVEYLWKQGRLYQGENGLNEEQVAFAVALLSINVRQTFPKGPEAFDALNTAAWDYFAEATKR
jgi:hypothetical protein